MFYIITIIIGIILFKLYHSVFSVSYFSCQGFAMELVAIAAIAGAASALICDCIGIAIPF